MKGWAMPWRMVAKPGKGESPATSSEELAETDAAIELETFNFWRNETIVQLMSSGATVGSPFVGGSIQGVCTRIALYPDAVVVIDVHASAQPVRDELVAQLVFTPTGWGWLPKRKAGR